MKQAIVLGKMCWLLQVVIVCLVVGAGIGFLLGHVASITATREYSEFLVREAAYIGGLVALLLGPALYLTLLGGQASFSEFTRIVVLTSLVGAVSAAGLEALAGGLGWVSSIFAIGTAITISYQLGRSRVAPKGDGTRAEPDDSPTGGWPS